MNRTGHISIFLLLSAMIVMVAVFSGCDYITGEAVDVPGTTIISPPRWGWTLDDSGYSIIIDRYTHQLIKDVTPQEAFGIMYTSSRSNYPVVIDVRTPQEYAGGYIHREAINIDYYAPSFRDDINQLDKNTLYIVYCRTGMRSSAARDIMEELGFKRVINMTDGIREWIAAGLPVDK
jgi:rhodanese-related sulfurtransferase